MTRRLQLIAALMSPTQTKEHTMKLTVHGPNLKDQSRGDFEVHAADCADNARVEYLFGKPTAADLANETAEYATAIELAETIYADHIDEGSTTAENELSSFHFAPCCADLPMKPGDKPKRTRKPAAKKTASKPAAKSTPAAKPAETPAAPKPPVKRGELTIPAGLSPRELIVEFLTETCSAAPDAAGQGRSYITAKGKVVTHAQWLATWLTKRLKTEVNTVQSSRLLRENGWKDRSLPVVGAKTTRLSVWVLDAPKSLSSIERQAAPAKPAPAAKPAAAKPAAKKTATKKSAFPITGETVIAAAAAARKPAAKKTTTRKPAAKKTSK
jgi:hypothetical protein